MKKLIFVYNANSGKLNALMDSLHKVVDPSSYSCKFCDLTYGIAGEKKAWKNFRQGLEVETEFLHKDEFLKLYASKFGHKFEFPLILGQTNNGLEVIMSHNFISDIETTKDLIDKLEGLI